MSIEDTLNCTACVLSNCTYVQEEYGGKCTDTPGEDQFTMWISHSVAECKFSCFFGGNVVVTPSADTICFAYEHEL